MHMRTLPLIVVGNKFINLTQQHNVVTFNQFEIILKRILETPILHTRYAVTFGQGLSEDQNDKLYLQVNNNNILSKHIKLKRNNPAKRSNKTLTHKHATKNILISDPFKIENNKYAAYLMIDDACAELSDHVTGQHLQGMVLIEAARQLSLAVTEKYFIADEQRSKVGFVTNNLVADFMHYAFPIQTLLEYQIEKARGRSINNHYNVTINIIQNDLVVAKIKYTFSTFDKSFLHEQENSAANYALKKDSANQWDVNDDVAA